MFGGVITTLTLFALIIGLTLYQKKKIVSKGQDFDRNDILGEYGIETLLICVVLLWIVPWGIIIILPIVLLISLIIILILRFKRVNMLSFYLMIQA